MTRSRPWHLVRRAVGTLVPLAPRAADSVWAIDQLLPGEARLWASMRAADRRHSIAVAKRVQARLGDGATRAILAAALLHDVGKVDADLGVYGRTVATLSGAAVRHDPETIRDWTRTRGFTRRVGLYLQHPKLGGDMLELAGSDPLTVTWTREHHLPAEEWTLAPDVARALRDADDD
ncbi:MAG: hypothetical protein R2726_21095 [Acidimicrobiales bacterium]